MTYQPKKSIENQELDQLPAPMAVARLGRNLQALQHGTMRRIYLQDKLLHFSPQVMVRIVACAHRESAMGNHQAACLLEVAIDMLVRCGLHEETRQQFLMATLTLCEHGVWALFQRNDEDENILIQAERLLIHPPKGSLAEKGETLGRRKSLAKTATGDLLDRIMLDPHKDVIHNALLNPRIDEEKVIWLCARRPVHPLVLEEVALSHFARRSGVRRAIVYNPSCPMPLACWLMTGMTRTDLMGVVNNTILSHPIRDAAQQLLAHKHLG